MEDYPEHAVAWFGVGCYYQSIGRFDSARQYFGKATTMDASFAPAWLGFSHAFAAQDESDQVQINILPLSSWACRAIDKQECHCQWIGCFGSMG